MRVLLGTGYQHVRPSNSQAELHSLPLQHRDSFTRISPLFGARRKAAVSDVPPRETVDLVLEGVDAGWAKRLKETADSYGISLGKYLQDLLPQFADNLPVKDIMPSVTATVTGMHQGKPVRTKVTTLIGPDQIFQNWVDTLLQTRQYAQVALFDFDNIKINGGRNVDGADVTKTWKLQQKVLEIIEEKARQGVRFQVLLDSHAQSQYDKRGRPVYPREINNEGMVKHLMKLKEEGLPIDVVTYPRNMANIYHIKLLISDGKRAIVGGMNLSNHSAANWDACVKLDGPEVANLQKSTFYEDWVFAKSRKDSSKTPQQIAAEDLPEITPVDQPAIRVLNTMPREYAQAGFTPREEIGDFFRNRLDSDTLTGVYSEQFIATHKVIRDKLIARNQQGIPVQMLHSAGVINKFPYSRNTVYQMEMSGVPVRFYPEHEATAEQLHAKWTLLMDKNPENSEIVIGSANTSAAAFETNLKRGYRNDYPAGEEQPYRRGNRDLAIVIPSDKIAETFKKQFEKDWEYSYRTRPPAYGLDVLTDKLQQLLATHSVGELLAGVNSSN